ncbi:MAG: hypothetical protein AAFX58_05430 [Pseudomonadota bacterium]
MPALAGALLLSAVGVPALGGSPPATTFTPERFVMLGVYESPTSDVGGNGVALRGRQQRLRAGFGVTRLGGGDLAIGLDYAYDRFEYDGIASRDRDLHRLSLPLVWRRESGASALEFALVPSAATSSNVFKNLWSDGGRDDFYLTGRVTASRTAGRWAWHIGAAADRAFGASALYPLVGAERHFGERWHLRLLLPEPALIYSAGDRHEVTLRAYPAGQRWHVVSDDFAADFDYRLRTFRTEAAWRLKLTRRFSVEASAAYDTGRRHEFADDALTTVDVTPDDGWTYGLAVCAGW